MREQNEEVELLSLKNYSMELKLIPEEEKYPAGTDASGGRGGVFVTETGSPSVGKAANCLSCCRKELLLLR